MLVATDLTRTYDSRVAVEGLSLTVPAGRVVGLVGTNGAGKTTTIKMVAGILEPTAGTATVEGEPTLHPQTRARIGYLPEESPLYDDLTPLQYLAFFGNLYRIPKASALERARRLLTQLDLPTEAWKRPIGTLSKGMRRKTAIARCLLHEPPVLVLDEPTSGLDPFTAKELAHALRRLRQDGKAILLSAHDLAQVEDLCDEILILHQGRLVARGTLHDLRTAFGETRYAVRATVAFPGSQPDGPVHTATVGTLRDVEDAIEHVKGAEGLVLEVESLFPSLEDIMTRAAAPHA